MFYQALALTIFSLSSALASPSATFSSSASKTRPLVKRADPSPYPGFNGSAYTYEPLYLNFGVEDPSDLNKVEQLHNSFGNEAFNILLSGVDATTDNDRFVFTRYFDDASDQADVVSNVFSILADASGFPNPVVQDFIFDNADFLDLCGDNGDDSCDDCDAQYIGAYTAVDDNGDGREKTHFCNFVFFFPSLFDIKCEDLDSYPSGKMENLGRIMLHEFLQYNAVGVQSTVGDQITNVENADGLKAFYPSRAYGLLAQDNTPEKTILNADNYAWLGQNWYFRSNCPDAPQGGDFNDPPPYRRGQEGDPGTT